MNTKEDRRRQQELTGHDFDVERGFVRAFVVRGLAENGGVGIHLNTDCAVSAVVGLFQGYYLHLLKVKIGTR